MKVQRGDLAVVGTTRRAYYLGGRTTETTRWEVYRVTSVSRDRSVARRVRDHYGTEWSVERLYADRVLILPQSSLTDPDAAFAATRREVGLPFPDLDAVRDALRPYYRAAA